MPHLVQVAAHHEHLGLQVLCVTEAPVADAVGFVDEHRLPFAVLADAVAVREAFGIEMIWGSPQFLLDGRGVVVAEGREPVEAYLEALAAGG